MPNFDSGVKEYVYGRATVEVGFPVDYNGHPDISCKQCQFFDKYSRVCHLTGTICAFPEKFVGQDCPLEPVESTEKVDE